MIITVKLDTKVSGLFDVSDGIFGRFDVGGCWRVWYLASIEVIVDRSERVHWLNQLSDPTSDRI